MHVLFVRHAGELLNDAAEDHVAEVRVGVLIAGGKIERLALHVTDNVAHFRRAIDLHRAGDAERNKHCVVALAAVPAGGVLEAVPHGDQFHARVGLGVFFDEGIDVE